MKNLLKTTVVFILILLSSKFYAQLDTLNYLKQFEVNKAQYIRQPFSKLLNDMTQIQPKTVWGSPIFNNITNVNESTFKFCKKEHSFKNSINLEILWQEDIPFQEVKYYYDKNHFYFTNEERAFYGNKIVKDIKVYRW